MEIGQCLITIGWLSLLPLVILGGRPGFSQPSPSPPSPNLTLLPGFEPNPTLVRGSSGGAIPASRRVGQRSTPTGLCAGYVQRRPDHLLTLSASFAALVLEIGSEQDTTLAIVGPGGVWCNDDAIGHNPRIAGQWLAGSYQIWIGSYESDQFHPYILSIRQSNP